MFIIIASSIILIAFNWHKDGKITPPPPPPSDCTDPNLPYQCPDGSCVINSTACADPA